jgi:hypothetical protein
LCTIENPFLLRNSLKVDALRIDLFEKDFPISQFPIFKIDHYSEQTGTPK